MLLEAPILPLLPPFLLEGFSGVPANADSSYPWLPARLQAPE